MTLTYQYSLAQVWLDALADERDPHAYDLCRRHADRLTAPQGWQVRDRRSKPALVEAGSRAEHADSYVAWAV